MKIEFNMAHRKIKKAKELVKLVTSRLQQCKEEFVIDQKIKEGIEGNPRIVFSLLYLLLTDHNPKDGVQKKSTAYQATLILLEEALLLIRYSVERDRSWAIDIAEQIQRQIAGKVFKREVDIRIQADLVHILYGSGLDLHPQVKAKSQDVIQYYSRFTARTGPPDMEKAFDAVISKADGNPFEVYERVMAELNLLPTEGQLTMIGEMVKSVNPLIREITSFMLLHPNPEIRIHVPRLVNHLAQADTISPLTLRRMIGLRNWLPEAERPDLDELIKRIRRANVQCAPMPSVQSVEAYVSPFDGSGLQGAWIFSREQQQYQMAMMLVRQGQGVREAWGENHLRKKDRKSMLRNLFSNGMVTAVRPAYLEIQIPHFIWLGQQQNTPPHPLLLHVAETMGDMYWLPQPVDFDEEFASLEIMAGSQSLSPENITKVLEESRYWPTGEHFATSWFEDDARVDELLKENFDFPILGNDMMAQAIGLILVEILQDKTDLWSERLFWMALWARSCKDRTRSLWRKFFIIARELRKGTPLYQIPLMLVVAERSVYSALRRMEDWS